jgi:hypothetical protein
VRGYHKPIDDPPSAARNKATLDKQLKGFKRLVKAVADKDFGGQGDAYLFKPAKARKDMLRGVGILGMHTSLSFNITVTDSEQKAIAKAFTKLNRTISNTNAEEFLQGTRKLQPHDIKMNGKTGWDSSLPVLNDETHISNRWNQYAIGNEPPRKNIAFYACPKTDCLKKEPSSAKGFQTHDLDRQQICRHCHRQSAARKWLCACGIPWYTCDTHKTYHCKSEVRLQSNQQPNAMIKSLRSQMLKKRRINMGHEEILAQERKRAKRKATEGCRSDDIELEDAPPPKVPRLLGPILQRRFRGIGRSSLSTSLLQS